MTDKDTDLPNLEAYFDAARRNPPELTEAALLRMTREAVAVQRVQPGPAAGAAAPRPRRLAQLFAALGGWPALAGLSTAGIAGLWMGVMPPVALQTLAIEIGVVGDVAEEDLYMVDPLPGYDLALDLGDGS
ncbi:hypothetical protein OB2597_00865 [Pseudooceanicola batsensis HTCC2597]|uniref:Dihydroorotate dehydrogenase n=1 Tax=Pseudooceanicola batsensis (strain ATCC BAA-863 / DSM 15984 / KCTC 12145 / HTCC2597) TaxID=252305 RepID=A3U1Z0_PSEBH|nr:hypothetical protein [Pseudooceanicola batsensis]EAQ01924.1 hypothetical protein OB2597_00865 [Pseudooceanicola batsensis HTCC2597]